MATTGRKLALGLAVLWLGPTLLLGAEAGPAAGPHDQADPVLAMLEKIRHVREDLFTPHSSILGDLPGPAELAKAQPHLRQIYAAKPPYTLDFTDAQRAQLARDYTYYTFANRPRSGLTPLGITGAYIQDIDGRAELVVIAVQPDTPAAGKLQVNDIIIGANGRLFQPGHDPRIPMGYALHESTTEKLHGKLTLQLVRGGKAMNVVLDMPILPPYSPNWPYDCPRSRQIADRMLRFILSYDRSANISRHGGGSFWVPQFLMASGDDQALELARRQLYRQVKDTYPPPTSGHTWNCSYALVNLSEYYLLTGDSVVLPAIDYYRQVLQNGQSAAGGWGHSCPCSGYGEVNAAGGVALTGLALAREIGLEMNKPALAQNIRYFSRFIGAGVPYGDHSSGLRIGRSNNGKAAMATMGFKFLGADDVALRWARAIVYMWSDPESGHAEGIFNRTWDPLAAALAPAPEFALYTNNLMWYYELAQTAEGGIRFLRGGHFPYPVGQTAAVGLLYMLPRKKIYLTGAPKSIFAKTPPDATLAKAAQLYKDKQWNRLQATLKAYLADDARRDHHDYARQLLQAYQRLEAHVAATLKMAEQNIATGHLYKARQQLLALERLVGQRRPAIAALLEKAPPYAKPQPQERYKKVEGQSIMFAFSGDEPPSYDWEYILPPAAQTMDSLKEVYPVWRAKDPSGAPAGPWYAVDYQPTAWVMHRGPIPVTQVGQVVWLRRTFRTLGRPGAYKYLLVESPCRGQLYLNGYKMADLQPGENYLRAGAAGVLRAGTNVLAVRLETTGREKAVDVGLKASPPIMPDMKGLLDDL